MLIMALVGFLSDEENSALKEPIPWKEATQKILGASNDSEKDLSWAIAGKANFKDNEQKEQLMAGLKWIGVVSSSVNLHISSPACTILAYGCLHLQTHIFVT
jgi:saccharopine dehydrogenase (NADP+, L-glutamate forming)